MNAPDSQSRFVMQIEYYFRMVLLMAGALYALGIVVSTVAFGQFGILQVSLVRPQHILTGGAFLALTCLPGLVIVGAKTFWSDRRKWSTMRRAVATLIAVLAVMVGVPLLLWPFVPMIEHAPLFRGVLQFWRMYGAPPMIPVTVTVAALAVFVAYFGSMRRYRTAMIGAPIVLFFSIWPYSVSVWPNVYQFVGGGQPVVVEFLLSPRIASAWPELYSDLGESQTRVSALLWHHGPEVYYVTAIKSKTIQRSPIFLIPHDAVEAVFTQPAHVVVGWYDYRFGSVTRRMSVRYRSL